MTFKDLGIEERSGTIRYATICPFCSHLRKKKTDPCLTVNNEEDNRWYHCNHCGESGNLDIMERYAKIKEHSERPVEEKAFSNVVSRYFRKRGISLSTVKRERIYETEKGIIGFPFYENKQLINVKFFNPMFQDGGLKWWQLKKEYGTKTSFLGLDNIDINLEYDRKQENYVIITEGEWDMLTWKEVGYKNSISVPQGAPAIGSKNFQKEFEYVQDPYFQKIYKDIDTFYLSIDADEAGELLLRELSVMLGKWKCRIIKYPKDYKDINEVFIGKKEKNLPPLGKDAVIDCFKTAQMFPIQGIIHPSDVHYEMMQYRKEGLQPGLGINVPELDFLFTIKKPHIMFVTGIPGMGKSVFVRWYWVQLVKVHPEIKVAMFTPENRPVHREYVKLAELLKCKSFMQGLPDSMTDEEWKDAMNFIEKHFIIVAPDRYNFESFDGSVKKTNVAALNSICKYISYLKKTEGIFGYIIDAYNKLDNDIPPYMSETKYIETQLDYLIDFNAFYDLFGCIIAHPTKLQKDKSGNYFMPALYDIKGSSAWYEKPDIGLVIHRFKFEQLTAEELKELEEIGEVERELKYKAREETYTYIKVEKIRFEEIGTEGILKMNFLKYNNFKVAEIDKDYHLKHSKLNQSNEDQKGEQDSLYLQFSEKDEDLPF